MMIVRIVLICIAAAMICAAVRIERPEMAAGISLAVGTAVILLMWQSLGEIQGFAARIKVLMSTDTSLFSVVVKAAGIAIVSEMGAQICADAGERALAGRIALASRISMLCLCAPMLERILEFLGMPS